MAGGRKNLPVWIDRGWGIGNVSYVFGRRG